MKSSGGIDGCGDSSIRATRLSVWLAIAGSVRNSAHVAATARRLAVYGAHSAWRVSLQPRQNV